MFGEDRELSVAIVYNDDVLSYGSIISVYDGTDEAITALTDDGVDGLRQMLVARRSTNDWNDFLEDVVSDPDIIARIKAKSPRQQSDAYIISNRRKTLGKP
ncbi:hypothetical protein NKI54_30265 [Mesorhizobium sp. M0663]|uniref:hypothetical protein n=1 Tax=Mesorhizobium sp. M0663 TaxID=2956981 RepID=UPI0033398231